jgi:hypothetical protein
VTSVATGEGLSWKPGKKTRERFAYKLAGDAGRDAWQYLGVLLADRL